MMVWDDGSLFKLYNLKVRVGRKLGGDVSWGQAASRGPRSMEGSPEPEAELPVFGNVRAKKGVQAAGIRAGRGLSAQKGWLGRGLRGWWIPHTFPLTPARRARRAAARQ